MIFPQVPDHPTFPDSLHSRWTAWGIFPFLLGWYRPDRPLESLFKPLGINRGFPRDSRVINP